jgi:hypothetical protein
VVEDRAEGVLRVVPGGGVLDRLADGDPQRARAVRRLGQDPPTVRRRRARAGDDLGPVGLHEDPSIRLLVVARPNHVDLDLEAEDRPGEGERASPLPRPGLGREPPHPFLAVEEGLGEGGVRLVAAGRTHALVLVVDVGRRIEGPLEAPSPVERRRPIEGVGLANRLRDLDLALAAHLLGDEGHREEGRQVVGPDRRAGAGMEDRRRRDGEVGDDVVPGPRDPLLVEDELRAACVGGHRHPPPLPDRAAARSNLGDGSSRSDSARRRPGLAGRRLAAADRTPSDRFRATDRFAFSGIQRSPSRTRSDPLVSQAPPR